MKHAAHASGRRRQGGQGGRLRHNRVGTARGGDDAGRSGPRNLSQSPEATASRPFEAEASWPPEADPGRTPAADPGRTRDADPGWTPGADPGRTRDADPGWAREGDPGRTRDDDSGWTREQRAGPAHHDAGGGRERGGGARRYAQLPYWVVLGVVALGLLVLRGGDGQALRGGTFVIAGALLAGSVIRLALPEGRAGMLGSRRRLADTAVLTVLGIGLLIVGLTMSVPG